MTQGFQRSWIFSLILAAGVTTFAANHSAIDPAPRGDQGWKDRQALLNKRAAEAGEKAEIIFIGDSITHGWEGAGKEIWAKRYAPHNAVNLGIGGDRTQHVLWRLENGNLKGLKPKAAVLMIGTNNSNGEDNSVDQIAGGIQAIVEKLRAELPETKILLLPIFPRGENPNPQRGKINQVNQIIHKLADNRNVIWVDFGYKFIDEKGHISREIMPDYLHLSPAGYEIWADSLERPLARALGENRRAGRSELSGDWVATLPGPNNESVELPFTLRVNGQRIAGSFHADSGDLKIEQGRLEGDSFSWTVNRERPNGGAMTYKMTGSLENGAIKGKAVTENEGNEVKIDWSAKRKQG